MSETRWHTEPMACMAEVAENVGYRTVTSSQRGTLLKSYEVGAYLIEWYEHATLGDEAPMLLRMSKQVGSGNTFSITWQLDFWDLGDFETWEDFVNTFEGLED